MLNFESFSSPKMNVVLSKYHSLLEQLHNHTCANNTCHTSQYNNDKHLPKRGSSQFVLLILKIHDDLIRPCRPQ